MNDAVSAAANVERKVGPPVAVTCPASPRCSAAAADLRAPYACNTDATPYPTHATIAAISPISIEIPHEVHGQWS
ncbi:hypothetical protein N806_06590 [Rhodococcus sp. P27]|nr:hypothetical protein N806_06590 [Rhodococcus sp. P27]